MNTQLNAYLQFCVNYYSPCLLQLNEPEHLQAYQASAKAQKNAELVMRQIIKAFGDCSNKRLNINELALTRFGLSATVMSDKGGFRDSYRNQTPTDILAPRLFKNYGIVEIRDVENPHQREHAVEGRIEHGQGYIFNFSILIDQSVDFLEEITSLQSAQKRNNITVSKIDK